MADPRGLSGAVFQPTQVRDFVEDLSTNETFLAKQANERQKREGDYYDQFKTGDIKNQSHRDFYQARILQPLKQQQQKVAELRMSKPNSPEYRAAQSRLENMGRAAISLPAGLNALNSTAASNKQSFDNAYEKGWVTDDAASNVDAYGRFVDGFDANYEDSYFDEKGDLIVAGEYYTQSLRPQEMRFNEPYDLQADILKSYTSRTEDGQWDKQASAQSIDDGAGTPKQQKQFYEFLKQKKGYDEDTIKSALSRPENTERLKNEFYEYSLRQIENSQSETSRVKRDGGSGSQEKWKTLGRVGDGTYGKALFLPKDKIKFDLKEFVDDGSVSAELVTDATVISLQPNKNADNILAEISYLKEDGFKDFKFVPLTEDQESIVAVGLGLPDNVSIRDFYTNRVGDNSNTQQKPQAEGVPDIVEAADIEVPVITEADEINIQGANEVTEPPLEKKKITANDVNPESPNNVLKPVSDYIAPNQSNKPPADIVLEIPKDVSKASIDIPQEVIDDEVEVNSKPKNEKEKVVKIVMEESPEIIRNPLFFASKYLGIREDDPEQQETVESFFESAISNPKDSLRGGNSRLTTGQLATERAWCAAFAYHVLKDMDFNDKTLKGYDKVRAKEYSKIGTPIFNKQDSKGSLSEANKGDIVVKKGDEGFHVGFYVGVNPDNKDEILILGGNQDDEVNVMSFPASSIQSVSRLKNVDDVDSKLIEKISKDIKYPKDNNATR